jgi:hypothetical protein
MASTALDKPTLIEEGAKLLAEPVYSVVALDNFRKKAKAFRDNAARLFVSQPSVPEVPSPPQDLLDWVSIEKASVLAVQDALRSTGE